MTVPETQDQWRIFMEFLRRPYNPTRKIACLTEWPPYMPRPHVPKPTAVLALLIAPKPYATGVRIRFVDG